MNLFNLMERGIPRYSSTARIVVAVVLITYRLKITTLLLIIFMNDFSNSLSLNYIKYNTKMMQ